MKTALIIIAMALILSGIVVAVWYYFDHKNPDEPDVPDTPDVPVPEPQPEPEPSPEPVDPDTPDTPDVPDPEPTPDPEPEPTPKPDPDPKPTYDETFEDYLSAFKDYAQIERDSVTYNYLKALYDEANCQFEEGKSLNGIPELIRIDNFPTMYTRCKANRLSPAFSTLAGYLLALQLASLKPIQRTAILKIGYELGGYDRYSNIYGYTFGNDPNDMRIVAGAIYSAMRGIIRPDEDTMRKEIGGTMYTKTLAVLSGDKRDNVKPEAFFIDFREYMPTAPGPYAPGYTTRPDHTYPYQTRDDYKNLQVDRDIHEDIITKYNLSSEEYLQPTVQAIADKEADKEHLFGKNRTTEHYHFHPVFGEDTIGIELADNGDLAEFVSLAVSVSSASRGILQSATVDPKQYGRLRPGCSWTQEAKKNSATDDRRNILTNFEIEDGDGSPTGYYDKNGNWVYKDAVKSPEEFEEAQKNALWANSYPSGHSAGIMGAAMVLIELMPDRADRILRAANQYAVNRTIARYHWTSDTINGRVLGIAQNAVAHAASDYDDLLDKAKKELVL